MSLPGQVSPSAPIAGLLNPEGLAVPALLQAPSIEIGFSKSNIEQSTISAQNLLNMDHNDKEIVTTHTPPVSPDLELTTTLEQHGSQPEFEAQNMVNQEGASPKVKETQLDMDKMPRDATESNSSDILVPSETVQEHEIHSGSNGLVAMHEQEPRPEENHIRGTPLLIGNNAKDDMSKDDFIGPVAKQFSFPEDANGTGMENYSLAVFATSSGGHNTRPRIVENNPKDNFPEDELIASTTKQYLLPSDNNNIVMATFNPAVFDTVAKSQAATLPVLASISKEDPANNNSLAPMIKQHPFPFDNNDNSIAPMIKQHPFPFGNNDNSIAPMIKQHPFPFGNNDNSIAPMIKQHPFPFGNNNSTGMKHHPLTVYDISSTSQPHPNLQVNGAPQDRKGTSHHTPAPTPPPPRAQSNPASRAQSKPQAPETIKALATSFISALSHAHATTQPLLTSFRTFLSPLHSDLFSCNQWLIHLSHKAQFNPSAYAAGLSHYTNLRTETIFKIASLNRKIELIQAAAALLKELGKNAEEELGQGGEDVKAEGIIVMLGGQMGGEKSKSMKRKGDDEVVKGGEDGVVKGDGDGVEIKTVKKRRGRKPKDEVASDARVAVAGSEAAEVEPVVVKKRRGGKPKSELTPGTGTATTD